MSRNEDQDESEMLKAERRRMAAAFDGVLEEPVPERLTALLAAPAVVDLAAERARRRGLPTWAAWGGMAASLVLGTLVGMRLTAPGGDEAGDRLVATGAVAQALERQLASAPAAGPVAVQLSFKARDGRWCRSFSTADTAGLACREPDGAWALRQVAPVEATPAGGMRQAASALPPAVLAAVDGLMAGEAAGAEQERAARDSGWRR